MIHTAEETSINIMEVTSSAFENNAAIPVKYTCDGLNCNPPLFIKKIPANARSLAIIVEDPDAPINSWIHWIVWNIPVTHFIKENDLRGKEGINDFSRKCYCGPCPISGTHRYFFKIYALDTILHLSPQSKKIDLERSMSNHILAFGQLVGVYTKKS